MPLLRFEVSSRQLLPTEQLHGPGWLHVKDPSAEELGQVAQALRFPRAFLVHALDENEVSRVDATREGALLVVLRGPYVSAQDPKAPYRSLPLGIVVLPHADMVVTISRGGGDILPALAERLQRTVSPKRFVLEALMVAAERFLVRLREIDDIVEAVEARLRTSQRNEEVLELLKYQKALVYFSTALTSNAMMLQRLRKEPAFDLGAEDHEFLQDVLVELRQADEMATVSGNILGEMMDAFASIISNNLNVVVKLLTALTLVVTVPNMIASFYGMNVRLPGADALHAFAGLVGVSATLSLVLVLLFLRKRWF